MVKSRVEELLGKVRVNNIQQVYGKIALSDTESIKTYADIVMKYNGKWAGPNEWVVHYSAVQCKYCKYVRSDQDNQLAYYNTVTVLASEANRKDGKRV